jgi:hypothetical protein
MKNRSLRVRTRVAGFDGGRQGRFDVDPKILGIEGFTRTGQLISY